jgi:hypothetical protein
MIDIAKSDLIGALRRLEADDGSPSLGIQNDQLAWLARDNEQVAIGFIKRD